MATFIRRGLTKLVEQRQQPKPAALVFSRTEGAVTLNAREASRYGMLMAMLDSDEDDQIGGMEGASFLRRSGLDTGEESEEWPPMPPPSTGRRRRRSRRRSRSSRRPPPNMVVVVVVDLWIPPKLLLLPSSWLLILN